ncbi:MAG: ATP-binding protein, partial [Bacteroidetes bacterium]|nr:ATP-binding protein [Bacteroidota bacterium]
MAKKIATLKQSSGEGFVFEDKVVAYFLIHLLNGIQPFENTFGLIEEIRLQKRALGYLLDDLIIGTKSPSSSKEYIFAFSIKSNKQITRSGFPEDFVSSCWEQIHNKSLPKFDKSKNFLGLITSPLAQDVKINLDELVRWGKEKKSTAIRSEIKVANTIKKALYQSLKCPIKIKKNLNVANNDPSEILDSIAHLNFDFLSPISRSKKEVVQHCREALSSNNTNEAEKLWQELVSLASRYRISGSDVSRKKIINDLDFKFKLKEYPDYKSDLEKLISYTSTNLLSIRDVFIGDLHLKREEELDELSQSIKDSSALSLLGRSGSGKSALLKNWTTENINRELIFWINSTSFENKDFAEFEISIRLDHSLQRICNSVSNRSIAIIDAVDSLISETGFNNFIIFLKLLGVSEKNCFWKIIITCQSDDWNRIIEKIKNNFPNLNIEKYELLESSSQKIVDEVIQKFETLFYLKRNKKIKQLLLNLKILYILISKATILNEQEVSKWVGESDVIEWYWSEVITVGEKSLVRGNIFKKLASEQGDTLLNRIPLTIFDSGELSEIPNLLKEKLCTLNEEKITFFHDLFGDWSRTKVLIGQTDLQLFLIPRITSPLWLKAIRYYGTFLLEQKPIDEWRKTLDDFETSQFKIISDSLLESILFSKNALINLEESHLLLLNNKSELLRRILKRFLFICTFPNPLYTLIEGEDITYKTIYSTIERIPNVVYWIPVLFYLINHSEEFIDSIPYLLTEITLKWLKYTPSDYLLRKEVAEMAIKLAEREYAYHHSQINYLDKAGATKKVYKAAMYASKEFPERIRLLALTACSRIEATTPITDEIRKINSEVEELKKDSPESAQQKFIAPSLSSFRGETPPAWPIGPTKSVDDDFREICLDSDALHPIIDSNPELAKEILLALLIKEPCPKEIYGRSHIFNSYEIDYDHEWFPPMYFRGPFLYFLRNNPNLAIDTIIELVNFSTDRWKDNLGENTEFDLQLSITFEGKTIVL